MGLDSVECIMRIEEEFGVELDDDELSFASTTGEVYEMVVARLRPAPDQLCSSQRAFHRLRGAVRAQFGLPRRAVQPALPLESMLPHRGRQRAWDELGRRMGLTLPALERSRQMKASVVLVPLVTSLPAVLVGAPLAGAALLAFGLLAWEVGTQRLAGEPPARDVEGLVRLLVERHSAFLCAAGEHDADPVWHRLVAIVAEQANLEASRVTYDARWVQDLGLS